MTAPPVRVDQAFGPERAADWARALAARLVRDDHLPEDQALAAACERLATGSPWYIAAPGQVWRLRPEFTDSEFAPELVRITAVARPTGTTPAQIHFADLHPEFGNPWKPAGWHHTEDFTELYDLDHWPPTPPAHARREHPA